MRLMDPLQIWMILKTFASIPETKSFALSFKLLPTLNSEQQGNCPTGIRKFLRQSALPIYNSSKFFLRI
jgi:hypothetical protein